MAIARAVPVRVIDDDVGAEAGIDRINAGQPDDPGGRGVDVLVGERVVPAIVAVVVEVVSPAARLRIAERVARIDPVRLQPDRSIELTHPTVDAVVRIAVVEDRGDVVPGEVGARQELIGGGGGLGGLQGTCGSPTRGGRDFAVLLIHRRRQHVRHLKVGRCRHRP